MAGKTHCFTSNFFAYTAHFKEYAARFCNSNPRFFCAFGEGLADALTPWARAPVQKHRHVTRKQLAANLSTCFMVTRKSRYSGRNIAKCPDYAIIYSQGINDNRYRKEYQSPFRGKKPVPGKGKWHSHPM